MNISDEVSFEEWFDNFVRKCSSIGYYGPIDNYLF